MIIRPALKNDLPRINELRHQVSELHYSARPDMFIPGFPQEISDYLQVMFNADDRQIIVAEMNNQIVAFACLAEKTTPATPYRPARHYLEVDEIGVDESVRRQGVGRKLFEEIRCIAMKKGFKRIELNMWDFNEDALKFYEAIGFNTYRRYMEMEIQ